MSIAPERQPPQFVHSEYTLSDVAELLNQEVGDVLPGTLILLTTCFIAREQQNEIPGVGSQLRIRMYLGVAVDTPLFSARENFVNPSLLATTSRYAVSHNHSMPGVHEGQMRITPHVFGGYTDPTQSVPEEFFPTIGRWRRETPPRPFECVVEENAIETYVLNHFSKEGGSEIYRIARRKLGLGSPASRELQKHDPEYIADQVSRLVHLHQQGVWDADAKESADSILAFLDECKNIPQTVKGGPGITIDTSEFLKHIKEMLE